MKENILLKLIDKINEEKWCFQYWGSCTTCGMMDVKRELKKYSFEDIIEAFRDLDYNDNVAEHREGLYKIYSLITGDNTVYTENFNFLDFEKKLKEKYPNNAIVSALIFSNYYTYWENWSLRQKKYEKEAKLYRQLKKKEREENKAAREKDNTLRGSQYQKDLISTIKSMSMKERFTHIANDTIHTLKFYPAILLLEGNYDFKKIDTRILEKIFKKFSAIKARKSPWRIVRKKIKETGCC